MTKLTPGSSVRREVGDLIITVRPEGIYFREKGKRYGVKETITRGEKTSHTYLGFCLPTGRAYQVAARLHADQVIADRKARRRKGK